MQELLTGIDTWLDELTRIVGVARDEFDIGVAEERLKRWVNRIKGELKMMLGKEESNRFDPPQFLAIISGDRRADFMKDVRIYRDRLVALKTDIMEHPDDYRVESDEESMEDLTVEEVEVSRFEGGKGEIFLIHGHDHANLERLIRMLKERWNLDAVVLKEKASRSRTLIEKLEGEGDGIIYTIALLTPDDIIEGEDKQIWQARPNVLFELGWFCGKYGRDRVCIVKKEGTSIPSDLDGVGRVEFRNDIKECLVDLEKELKAAGVVAK